VPKWGQIFAYKKIDKKFAFCSNQKIFFTEVLFQCGLSLEKLKNLVAWAL